MLDHKLRKIRPGKSLVIRKEGGARWVGDRIIGCCGLQDRSIEQRQIGPRQAGSQRLVTDMVIEGVAMTGAAKIDLRCQQHGCRVDAPTLQGRNTGPVAIWLRVPRAGHAIARVDLVLDQQERAVRTRQLQINAAAMALCLMRRLLRQGDNAVLRPLIHQLEKRPGEIRVLHQRSGKQVVGIAFINAAHSAFLSFGRG